MPVSFFISLFPDIDYGKYSEQGVLVFTSYKYGVMVQVRGVA